MLTQLFGPEFTVVKDKENSIADYLKSLEVGSTTASSRSAPAAPAVKTKKIDYEFRIVCFIDTNETNLFAQELMNQNSSAVCVYCKDEIDGTEDTGAAIEEPPMVESVKHSNILIVIAVNDFGPGSAKLLKKLHKICEVAQVWGGRMLVVMPYLANAWGSNKLFTKLCVEVRLNYVVRSDEEMGFIKGSSLQASSPC